jgi:hypothetical protein
VVTLTFESAGYVDTRYGNFDQSGVGRAKSDHHRSGRGQEAPAFVVGKHSPYRALGPKSTGRHEMSVTPL